MQDSFQVRVPSAIMKVVYSTRQAKGDADVMIVDTAITKARDQTTVLIGEDTGLLVLLLYHAEMDAKELFFRPEPCQ